MERSPLSLTYATRDGTILYGESRECTVVPLRVTKEVIRGVNVTRYNGNNPSGSRAASSAWDRKTDTRERIKNWQKKAAKRRAREKTYARRYLSG